MKQNHLLEVCFGICEAWNQACAQMQKANPKHNKTLLKRLLEVELAELTDHKICISAKTTKDYHVLIKDSGFYTCDCAAFEYSRKEEDGVGFPCKHLCVVASHAAKYLYNKEFTNAE